MHGPIGRVQFSFAGDPGHHIQGAFEGPVGVFLYLQHFFHVPAQQGLTQIHAARPGEAFFQGEVFFFEPGIAAEHLVAAFSGNYAGTIPANFPGEKQHGGIDVSHARKAPGVQSFAQRTGESLIIQDDVFMFPGKQFRRHGRVIPVPLRLIGVAGKFRQVALIIHRKGAHGAAFCVQKRRQSRGIQSAGKHGAVCGFGNVLYRPLQHGSHGLHRGLRAVLVRPGPRREIPPHPYAPSIRRQTAARLQGHHVPQRRFSRGAGGPQGEKLVQALSIHNALGVRGIQQCVGMVGKGHCAPVAAIKQPPFPHSVPGGDEGIGTAVDHHRSRRAFNISGIFLAPAPICGGYDLFRPGAAVQFPGQGGGVADAPQYRGHDFSRNLAASANQMPSSAQLTCAAQRIQVSGMIDCQ